MTPHLAPVRGARKRPGVDRGVAVAAAAAVLIGLLVAKPWGENQTATDRTPVGASPGVLAVKPAEPPAGPNATPDPLSLESVTAALGKVPRELDSALIVSLWRPDPVNVSYLDVAPLTTDLGSDCAGGALLGEGTDAIGITLPLPSRPSRVMHLRLARLFDRQGAVPVPLASELDSRTGTAVIRPDGVEWSVGHYALTMDTVGRSGTVALCFGRQTRLVDYSLVTFVPDIVDSADARNELLRQLARSN